MQAVGKTFFACNFYPMVKYFKNLVKKYGWRFLILGGVGKMISLTCVVGIYGHWFAPVLPSDMPEAVIYLNPGAGVEELKAEIDSAGGHGERLGRLLWARGWEDRVKPGKYIVEPGCSMSDAAQKFATGDRESVRVVVPASRDLEVVAGKIAAPIAADSAEVYALIKADSVRWQIVPNTYDFWWESTAVKAVAKLKAESQRWWSAERVAKAKAQGLTPEEAVVLASIVQAETANRSEAATVAGLYLNRLRRGQLLQADPTLIYALGDPTIRRVLDVHKEVESPYNTYKHVGLPPGTIRTPEPTYVDAVLNAEDHDFLYMCAEPGGTGNHAFARTYREHKRNARKYQQWLNKQRIYR